MSDWMTIRVLLRGRHDTRLSTPPGRILLVHADHTFGDLAGAIDVAFGRWDLDQLHLFEVEGRRLLPGGAAGLGEAQGDLGVEPDDSDEVALGEVRLRLGTRFSYVFDLDRRWVHECAVDAVTVDPYDVYGEEPDDPVPVLGWGTIPDQYGALTEADATVSGVGADDRGAAGTGTAEPSATFGPDEASLEDSWEIVAGAVADIDRPLPAGELATATARLRARRRTRDWAAVALWAAAGLDDDLDDDERLWLELAAGLVAPRDTAELDPELEAATENLEPADWAGAVIELCRAGVGQAATPETLAGLIARCPEVDADELAEQDRLTLQTALDTVVRLWRALGAVTPDDQLTALGRWGLVEALRVAWTEP